MAIDAVLASIACCLFVACIIVIVFLSVSLAKAKTKSKVLELSVAKAQAPKIIKAPPDPAKTPAVASVPQALDISHVGIAVLDHEQKIVYHNKITPITKKMDEPEHLGLLFDPGDNVGDWLKTIDGQALRAEKAWYRVPGIPNDDGERQFYDVIATYEAGNTAETVLVIIDRSDMYSIEENDLNFIAFAAHELRGPITTIRGYLDVLEDELGSTLSPDHKELFDRMVVSSNKLASYINNILNVSNYDGQHMQLILKETTLQSIFNSIMDDVLLRAVSQGKHLYIKLGDNLPTIAADITSLGEVFINLIDNAIKYSHEDGDIEVSTDVDGDHVLVFIVDHGIGIPTSVIGNIFKKFYRSHRSRGTIIGTGIGLYISKAIVQSHGGDISVSSAEGQGATFTVSLPTYASQSSKLQPDGGNATVIEESPKNVISNHGMIKE